MLEETGLPYEPHLVSFDTNDQMSPEFLSLNPNNKIPAILDPERPGRQAAGAVRVGRDPDLPGREDRAASCRTTRPARYETIQWLMFQMGGIGPMFGQLGFFHKFAGKDYEDKRPRDRYVAESKRLLGVLDQRLAGRAWIMGDDYTHRRHRHLPVGAQPDRLLRRRRAGGHRRLPARHARAGGLRGAAGGRARPADPAARRRRPERRPPRAALSVQHHHGVVRAGLAAFGDRLPAAAHHHARAGMAELQARARRAPCCARRPRSRPAC